VQPTSGYFLTAIITFFTTVAFGAILVVIFGVIIRRRKESIKNQRQKDERHNNEYKFDDGLQKYDDIIHENEENTYEIVNYDEIGKYDEINENESKIEANTSKTNEYLEIS